MGSLTIKDADRVLYGEKPVQNNLCQCNIHIFWCNMYIALA